MSKVTELTSDNIIFDNGAKLFSQHETECCEEHYLNLADLELEDFDGLSFDLTEDNFFERVEGYGIRLLPTNGHPIPVPGHGSNNGYYSSNLRLILSEKEVSHIFDIEKCQVVVEPEY